MYKDEVEWIDIEELLSYCVRVPNYDTDRVSSVSCLPVSYLIVEGILVFLE